jgi:hypothetical protein
MTAAMLLLVGCGVRPAEGNSSYFDFYDPSASDCGHEVKPIASMELVSQEKPLVFFELMEEPKIEGVKVKLTYTDGSSEVVEAYDLKYCSYDSEWSSGDAGMEHHRGMFFSFPEASALNPGRQQTAMFYVDLKRAWSTDDGLGFQWYFDSLHPENAGEDYYGFGSLPLEDTDVAYCMVEVYAQTGDEYIAEHKAKYTLVTESSGGKVTTQKGRDSYGLIKLLVQESGAYEIKAEEDNFPGVESYAGSGEYKYVYEVSDNFSENHYVKLNANEPMFLRVWLYSIDGTNMRVSLTRVPDGEVSWEE